MCSYPGLLRYSIQKQGVQKLLDAVIEYMPSPLDIPAIKGVDMEGNEIERQSSDEEPFSALVFKIMTDPFVGKLAYFRVLLRYIKLRFLCTERYKGQEGACRTYSSDACK